MKKLLLSLIVLSSCSAPKDLIEKIDKSSNNWDCKSLDYQCILPSLNVKEWVDLYVQMDEKIPSEVRKNQASLSSRDSKSIMEWCFPSARPYVHLDTLTKVINKSKIIGDWRIICNRSIQFKDSISYKDSLLFHRSTKLIRDIKDDDVIVRFSDTKVKLYVKKAGSNVYRLKVSRYYNILDGRYLLIYNHLMTTSGTAFIGITSEKSLI